MNYGLISLIFLQFACMAVCVALGVRLWNLQSGYERAQNLLETRMELQSEGMAHVRAVVDALELSHYKALAARQQALEQSVARWEAKAENLFESQQSLSAKLASREKLERKAIAAADAPAAAAGAPQQVTLEELIAQGHAMPLGEPQAPAKPSRNGSFGRKV